jgi:hypothetical protein
VGSLQSSRGSSGGSRSFIQIHERLAIALCSIEQAHVLLPWGVKNAHFVPGVVLHVPLDPNCSQQQSDCEVFEPVGLTILHGFCEDLLHSRAYKHGKVIVVCAGNNPKDITSTALMLGGFMILNYGFHVDDVVDAFEPIMNRFLEFDDQLDVCNCLSTLHHVHSKCGWLKLNSKFQFSVRRQSPSEIDLDTIDMEEYVHYDSPVNGNLHVLVPEKLLVFNCPTELKDGALWSDSDAVRYFSAAYYADIFGDFGVSVVVRACGHESAGAVYDPMPFMDKGIDVEDLPLDADSCIPTLAWIDRFLALARHAPGAIAVHGGPDGLGAAGTLIAAHLISAHQFRAKDAIAWVRMIHPAALPPAHQCFIREKETHLASHRHSMPCLAIADQQSVVAVGLAPGGTGTLEALSATLSRSVSEPRILDCLGFDVHSPAGAAAAAAAGSPAPA